MPLLKAESAVAAAAELGKTVTATTEHTFAGSAVAFASGSAYFGNLRVSKISHNRSGSVTTKFGLTTGAGQVTRKATKVKEQNAEVNGALFTSLESENLYVEFEGYKFTYTP